MLAHSKTTATGALLPGQVQPVGEQSLKARPEAKGGCTLASE